MELDKDELKYTRILHGVEKMTEDYAVSVLKQDLEHHKLNNNKDMEEIRAIEFILRCLQIKNEYLSLIYMTGVDYDGLEKPDSLKELIDELIDYANKARRDEDTTVEYIRGHGKKLNILREPLD